MRRSKMKLTEFAFAVCSLALTAVAGESSGRAQIDKINFEEVREEPVAAVYSSAYRNLAWEGGVSFFGALDLEGNGIATKDARVESVKVEKMK